MPARVHPATQKEKGTKRLDILLATPVGRKSVTAACTVVLPPEDLAEKARFRRRFRIGYAIAVSVFITLAYCLFVRPDVLPHFYSGSVVLLVAFRWFYYYSKRWHHFCIDFCYLGNTLLILYIYAFPREPRLFSVIFALANGPLATAVFIFKNSLVLTSLDKCTSVYIHVLPPIVVYSLRWHAPNSHYDVCVGSDCASSMVWTLAAPMVLFIGHSFVYFIYVEAIPHPKLRADPRYLYSFNYLSASWPKSPIAYLRRLAAAPRYKQLLFYYVSGWTLALCTMAPTILYYRYENFNTIYLALVGFGCAFNGGEYYASVLWRSRRLDSAEDISLATGEGTDESNLETVREDSADCEPCIGKLTEQIDGDHKVDIDVCAEQTEEVRRGEGHADKHSTNVSSSSAWPVQMDPSDGGHVSGSGQDAAREEDDSDSDGSRIGHVDVHANGTLDHVPAEEAVSIVASPGVRPRQLPKIENAPPLPVVASASLTGTHGHGAAPLVGPSHGALGSGDVAGADESASQNASAAHLKLSSVQQGHS